MILYRTDEPLVPVGEIYRVEHSSIVVGGLYPASLLAVHQIAVDRAIGLVLLNQYADAKATLALAGMECLPRCRNLIERNFDVAFFGLPENEEP